jgi:hypothetical protein
VAGNPTLKVFLDWDVNGNYTGTHDDVSDRAVDDPGAEVFTREMGASLDGTAGTPGSCTVKLWNRDNKLTAGNAGSAVAGKIVPGVPIRVQAIYNSTTYPLFEGRVRRFVPNYDLPTASIDVLAEDEFTRFDQRRVSLALAESRSIWEFREALLQQYGLTAGQIALSKSAAEAQRVPTSADLQSLLSILGELNEATRSIDFIRPISTGFQYVTKDRATLLGGAVAKTYVAGEVWAGSWDVSDEYKTNYQLVEAAPFVSVEEEEELWRHSRRIHLNPGQTRVKIAKWSDPLLLGQGDRPAERTRHEIDATGTATVSVTYYSRSARCVFSGGVSGGVVKEFAIYGYPAEQQGFGYEESDLSAGDLTGRYDGADVSSRFLASDTDALALAKYLTFVGTQPPLTRPALVFKQDLLPDVLQREPGDLIVFSDPRLGIVSQRVVLESTRLSMLAGGHWRMTAQSRSIPALSVVTIGGTAAQGIGGTAILGY